MDSKQLAQYIDHTALTAEKTEQNIRNFDRTFPIDYNSFILDHEILL